MSHDGIGPRAVLRSVAFLTAGMLTLPALAGCGSEDPAGEPLAGADVASADRADIADGGTLRWAVDTVPDTLNTFQADADTTTARIAEAVLPSMYRTDGRGRAVRNPDYLASAEVVDTGRVAADEFLAGYGAAQAVPGPLFTFAAYLGVLLVVTVLLSWVWFRRRDVG